MGQFMLRRTMYAVVTFFILSLTIFTVVRLTGDPVTLLAEPGARAEDLDRIRAEWGLDRSLPMQYLAFAQNIFTDFKRHDLGPNFYERNYDGTLQQQFLTRPLWGIGAKSSFGHDGRSISLDEVILRHGGEAQGRGRRRNRSPRTPGQPEAPAWPRSAPFR